MPAKACSMIERSTLLEPRATTQLRGHWSRGVKHLLAIGVATIVAAAPASAQWRVGGFLGGEHDSSWDEFLVIGADARGAVGTKNIELNPRVSYFLRDGVTRVQLDFNIIKPLALASSTKLLPYVGAGVAFEHVSFDDATGVGTPAAESESNPGFNYIVGSTLKVTGRVQPFAQFTYSVLHEAPNSAVVTFGVHFKLGAGGK